MHPVTPAGALIGRDNEMTLLAELIRGATRGRGGSVLIEGEPGIGKSALMRAVTGAPEVGCDVLWGAGDELCQELPLYPFLDGLRVREPSANPRRTMIAQLLRGEIVADSIDVPAVLAEQLLVLVKEQCAVRATILVIDDLQWADQATVALWARLARSAQQMPLLLAGMTRPVPRRDDVLALRRESETTCLRVAGLTRSAVAELVGALVGGEPDENLLRLADGAAGNPLYLTELVAALTRNSSVTVTAAGTVTTEPGAVPASLSAAIADRLGFVPGPVRQVLQAAALLGADFAVADLAIVLARHVTDLAPAIEEACTAGVLIESASGLGFRHPLIRAALYDEMSSSVRAAWHREAGRAFALAGAPADRVARQMLRAVTGPHVADSSMDDWMLDWLARTADPLVGQAPRVAVELLARAVQAAASSPLGSAQRGLLVSRLADALYRVGDSARAEEVATRALEHVANPDLLVDLHWTLVQCRLRAGTAEGSLAVLAQALELPGISEQHRARLLVLVARTHSSRGEHAKAGEIATGALAVASAAGDTWAMGWALHVMSLVTAYQGRETDALPLFDRALTVTESDSALADLHLLLQVNRSVVLCRLDRCEDALVAACQARDLADQIGTVVRLGQAHCAVAQLSWCMGRWDDALTEAQIIHPNLTEPVITCSNLGITAAIRLHRGEPGAARAAIAAAVPHAAQLGHRFVSPLTLAISMEREQAGALPEALGVLTGAVDGTEEIDEVEDLLPDAVRLASQAGDVATARAMASRAAELAVSSPIAHRQATVLYCGGLLDHDATRLLAAADRYDDASRPLLQAKALAAAAREFVLTGELSKARTALGRAVDAYTVLGAAADIAQLQAEFRACGIRLGPRGHQREARSGWASLTPTEIKVAGLVEEGLSNPEIAERLVVSARTVGSHVSSILKKLGIHTRTEMARESVLRAIAPR